MTSESPLSDSSVVTAITRRVDSYMELVDEARQDKTLRAKEADLLDRFERYTADILDRYSPPSRRGRESLVFAHIYQAWDPSLPGDDRRRALIKALMAADVESRGPLRLTRAQNKRLAAIFEKIGKECRSEKLFLHAELAFDHAAGIYLQLGDNIGRDRCLYARSRERQRASKPGWEKTRLSFAWILCGYGYKPQWLLFWVIAQLAVFTVFVAIARSGPLWQNMYLCLVNYLDPHDADNLPDAIKILLVIESYFSLVSISVFFALLVHKWFRI
ncbi:hypothetical protein [Actinophytocola sp.]|uniref:hypothetical protein n=1 Tax=Actinophytocola sp. TaxID=1872138 RepID=UPI002D80A3CE|nr:hypothetical protein [Actinophytocola sp.]HET9142060.1 hypothetical protein [Actinophytocola sp.]